MSKFLLNLLPRISKALENSKIQFLIQKFFFLLSARPTLRPTQPKAQPAPAGLSSPAGRSPHAGPRRSTHARRWRNCRSTLSPLIHAFRLSAFSLSSADAWVLRVSPVFPTALADPGRKSSVPPLPCAAAPRLGCRRAFTAPRRITLPP
jgi:hypothetical protein